MRRSVANVMTPPFQTRVSDRCDYISLSDNPGLACWVGVAVECHACPLATCFSHHHSQGFTEGGRPAQDWTLFSMPALSLRVWAGLGAWPTFVRIACGAQLTTRGEAQPIVGHRPTMPKSPAELSTPPLTALHCKTRHNNVHNALRDTSQQCAPSSRKHTTKKCILHSKVPDRTNSTYGQSTPMTGLDITPGAGRGSHPDNL